MGKKFLEYLIPEDERDLFGLMESEYEENEIAEKIIEAQEGKERVTDEMREEVGNYLEELPHRDLVEILLDYMSDEEIIDKYKEIMSEE